MAAVHRRQADGETAARRHPADGETAGRSRRVGGEAGVRLREDRGQATAELVALLPVVIGLLACAWQVVLAGHAVLAAGAAARAASRAQAIGLDAPAAARAHLPARLERGLRVAASADGAVAVSVRIPTLPGLPPVGHATATARFDPQR